MVTRQISLNGKTKMYTLQKILVPLLLAWLVDSCVGAGQQNHPLLNDPELPDDIDKRNGAWLSVHLTPKISKIL